MRVVVVILLALAAGSAHAERSDAVAQARRSYEELRYDDASLRLEAALEDPHLSRQARLEALELKGIVEVIRGDEEAARASFRGLLAIAPDATLPSGLSPKITNVFDDVRASMGRRPPEPKPVAPPEATSLKEAFEDRAASAAPTLERAPEDAPSAASVESTTSAAAAAEDDGVSAVAVGVALGAAVAGAILVVGASSLLLFSRPSTPESSLGTLQLP